MTKSEAQKQLTQLVKAGIVTVSYFAASGKGGQHGNRTMSGVQLVGRWTINGEPVKVAARAYQKSQYASKKMALIVLKSRLLAEIERSRQPERRDVGGWGGEKRIRTYHEPDNRVTDHASGLTMSWHEVVNKNHLAPMIEARRNAQINQ